MIRVVVAFILAVAVSSGEGPKILDITISPPNPSRFSEVFAIARIHSPSGKPSHLDWKLLYNGKHEGVNKIYKLTKLSENEYKSGALIVDVRIRPGHSIYLEVKNDFGSDTKEVKLHVGVSYMEECDETSNGTAVCVGLNMECRDWLCRCREGYGLDGVEKENCYPVAGFGEHCNSTIACEYTTVCNRKEEKCVCRRGYYWDSFYSSCNLALGYMEQCDDSIAIERLCAGHNMECRDWQCKCRVGYEVGVDGRSCFPVAWYGEHCNSTIACVNTTVCNGKVEQCLCRQGYFWDSSFGYCREGQVYQQVDQILQDLASGSDLRPYFYHDSHFDDDEVHLDVSRTAITGFKSLKRDGAPGFYLSNGDKLPVNISIFDLDVNADVQEEKPNKPRHEKEVKLHTKRVNLTAYFINQDTQPQFDSIDNISIDYFTGQADGYILRAFKEILTSATHHVFNKLKENYRY